MSRTADRCMKARLARRQQTFPCCSEAVWLLAGLVSLHCRRHAGVPVRAQAAVGPARRLERAAFAAAGLQAHGCRQRRATACCRPCRRRCAAAAEPLHPAPLQPDSPSVTRVRTPELSFGPGFCASVTRFCDKAMFSSLAEMCSHADTRVQRRSWNHNTSMQAQARSCATAGCSFLWGWNSTSRMVVGGEIIRGGAAVGDGGRELGGRVGGCGPRRRGLCFACAAHAHLMLHAVTLAKQAAAWLLASLASPQIFRPQHAGCRWSGMLCLVLSACASSMQPAHGGRQGMPQAPHLLAAAQPAVETCVGSRSAASCGCRAAAQLEQPRPSEPPPAAAGPAACRPPPLAC